MLIKGKLSQLPTWGALFIWTTVSIVAYGLVGFMFHFPSGFPPNNGENFNVPALAVGALQGGFTGLVIGSLQALLLRPYVKGSRWWIAASAFSLALTHAIGDALPDPIALPVVQVAGGIILGIGQWLVVRIQRLTAVVWIVAMGIAWFAGLTLGLTIMKQIASDWQTQHVVAGLTTGIAVSIATGALFVQLISSASNEKKAS
jgi:hypothetical protein